MTAQATLGRAGDFIWRNGRLLERRRFPFLFGDGAREPVLAALRAYQNPDGGFGEALEPDLRGPDSQPVCGELALRVLDETGLDASMVRRLCEFLTAIATPEGGLPFVLPSARAYPHAPWWEAGDDPPASLNPTAAIAGWLHKHGVRHPWLDQATEYCWREIAGSATEEVHELAAVLTFLEHAPDRARAEREFERIGARILGAGLVALDPAASGYVKKPLDWAPSPRSLCRRLFVDDVLTAHLEALEAEQQGDGGWPISWPPVSPTGELEWRGWVTIEALKTLRAYGRLDA